MHIQKKVKTNLTIRIDKDQKEKLEKACDYLGLTVTAVFNRAVRQTLDEYYKRKLEDTRTARSIAEGDQYQYMFQAAKLQVKALQAAGFDKVLDNRTTIETVRYQMFYDYIFKHVCMDLNIPFEPMFKRLKNDKSE